MSNKNILEAIEGISNAISGGGGGFTMVYPHIVETDGNPAPAVVLVTTINGESVPFTLEDLMYDTQPPSLKTIPVTLDDLDILLMNAITSYDDDGSVELSFRNNITKTTIVYKTSNIASDDYKFYRQYDQLPEPLDAGMQ